MKFLFLINLTFFICGGFLELFSQGLSPQAQTVLDRLSPEQRAMALREANRMRGSGQVAQEDGIIPSATSHRRLLQQVDASGNEEESEVEDEEEDQILILSELELSVTEDLEIEKFQSQYTQQKLDTVV